MPRIILVMGLPGSGKTFFAKRLAGRIGAVHVSSDEVRKEIDGRGKYSATQKLLVYEEMARRTSVLLSKNVSVVVDATFHRKAARELFLEVARRSGAQIRIILVQADESIIAARLRHPRVDSEADFDVYLKIRNEFEPVASPHLKLTSTDMNLDEMIEKAMTFLEQ